MEQVRLIRLLAISGSLQRVSINGALIHPLARLTAEPVHISIYDELASLPHFNPDDDREPAHPAVARLRHWIQSADALVISSPQYARGVPGTLKNALDWLVRNGEMADKPVALLHTGHRAIHAWASLAETLAAMSANVVPAASLVSLQGQSLDADTILEDPVVSAALRSALGTLITVAREPVAVR